MHRGAVLTVVLGACLAGVACRPDAGGRQAASVTSDAPPTVGSSAIAATPLPAGPAEPAPARRELGAGPMPPAAWTPPPGRAGTAAPQVPDEAELAPSLVHLENMAGRREGTGVVVSAEGHVLTAAHVCHQALSLMARGADGESVTARVLAADDRSGLALLLLPSGRDGPYAALGSAAGLASGDAVTAVGFPLGFGRPTFVRGVVAAAPARSREGSIARFLVDAPVNPGSLGGPILDGSGSLVGILTGLAEGGARTAVGTPVNHAAALPLPGVLPLSAEFRAWAAREPGPAGPAAATVMVRSRDGARQGSGFFVSADGDVITTSVLAGADPSMDVILPDGAGMVAAVVGGSSETGLAALKLPASQQTPFLTLGDATEMAVGAEVRGVGYAHGAKAPTLHRGVVTAAPVVLPGVPWALLQFDASVNLGGGGGPLLDSGGRVVGIIAGRIAGAEGISFAIPANYAASVSVPSAQRLEVPAFAAWKEQVERRNAGAASLEIPERAKALIRVMNGKLNGTGTGFFVSADGYAVTCHHVVPDSSTVEVELAGGVRAQATVVAAQEKGDIALLKVDGVAVPGHLELGDALGLRSGSEVVAAGFPLGMEHPSFTRGTVSACPVYMEGQRWAVIQTDAAVNPGNSGGPLLDARGRAVGVVTSKILGAERLGFAIPANYVSDLPLPGADRLRTPAFERWIARAERDRPDGRVDMGEPSAPGAAKVRIVSIDGEDGRLRVHLALLSARDVPLRIPGGVVVTAEWTGIDGATHEKRSDSCDGYERFAADDFRDRDGIPLVDVDVDCPGLATAVIFRIEVRARADGAAGEDVFRGP